MHTNLQTTTIQANATHMTPGKAHQVAAKLNADKDDDWVYVVRHVPGGRYSIIEAHARLGAYYVGTL